MRAQRLSFGALVVFFTTAAWCTPAAPPGPGYEYFAIGDPGGRGAGRTEAALMLMGGGEWARGAFEWFAGKAGHGHIVILRASGGDELQKEIYEDIGGFASAQTLVFSDRKAASDRRVLGIIRRADAIFIGGGDQSKYVRYWKGTPVAEALDEHVRRGRPLGGTSAGLAILGAYSYGALDGGSLASKDALQDPMTTAVTLVRDFLHLPRLEHVITDSHFAERRRLGRLATFIARLAREEGDPTITGIGVDEDTALCLDARGIGRVFSDTHGSAWLVRPMRGAERMKAGEPLEFKSIPIVGIGVGSTLDLNRYAVERPSFELTADASGGAIETRVLPGARWSLAIHGGAGVIQRGDLSPEREASYRAALDAALVAGSTVLKAGGSSLDAVEAAVRVLEDDPLFNAGKGAVFTAEGRNELDASIMDGRGLEAGAVAGVTRTRNPVSLARAVMERSRHVMLARDGADAFSMEHGLEQVDPQYFRTEERWRQLENWRRDHHLAALDATHAYGTVGAVALDASGHLAAATSTGGLTGKRWGRIGDSPVIGAGTYAADGLCAVSATGTGEYFIRASAARQVCDRVAWKGESIAAAADGAIADVGRLGGDGGLVAMDAEGNAAFAMNSSGMYRGWITSRHAARTAVYADEAAD